LIVLKENVTNVYCITDLARNVTSTNAGATPNMNLR
jgi:hypothetical protein